MAYKNIYPKSREPASHGGSPSARQPMPARPRCDGWGCGRWGCQRAGHRCVSSVRWVGRSPACRFACRRVASATSPGARMRVLTEFEVFDILNSLSSR